MGTYVPLALRDVDLRSSDTRWEDIGGLEEVRSTLRETLELPTRFAPMFAALPLKLRSGLLLYGPPGCGKSVLRLIIAFARTDRKLCRLGLCWHLLWLVSAA